MISGTPTTAGTSTVTVTAKDGNGAYATQSFVWTVSPGSVTTPPPPPGSLQISAGGPATGTWVADEDFSGGTTSSTTHAISTTGVTNPAPQSVYQHNRYGNFTYSVAGYTPGATYTIRLHFAEEYWTTAGSRIFNVLIDGTQVLTNFDILATAGGEYDAVVEQFTETVPSNGIFTIQFVSVKDNAQVNGIEILSSSSPAPPPTPTGLAATPGNGSVALSWTASSGATGYNIYRGTTSGGEGSTPVATTASTSYHRHRADQRHHLLLQGHRDQQRRHVGAVQRGVRDADDDDAAAVQPADQRRRSGDRDLGGR